MKEETCPELNSNDAKDEEDKEAKEEDITLWSFSGEVQNWDWFYCILTQNFWAVPRQLYRFICTSLPPHLQDTILKNTTVEHYERLVTLQTCYQSDEETRTDQQKDNDNDKWQLENTLKDWLKKLLTIEISDQSDEETWHDQRKDNVKDKDKGKYKYNDNDKDI